LFKFFDDYEMFKPREYNIASLEVVVVLQLEQISFSYAII